ncbi:ClC family H(+)/Cl(-) exchange transporter [Enterococcus saccharolyticus]|uniref:ClC family H(+)/Cl(-) exchange transporter n=1 Tax=Candidatus Enterococcus willemsii TaxID=1857215 RepID=A0ABQ6YX77_9ENTE|nr:MULTISPECIES: ClC family H(+)/Cl(-) exchange transporter [Enterococcus]KAF1302098.1 ClC family H(+)/Cl(-) exchange transporter [Enterococcus sp. CU12B]MCD5001923.1 ClC family H(+)/Cl(-) exchange transporter [Enterococcus saccharolyticus]
MNEESELKKIDGTKMQFIGKGLLVGLLSGVVVSFFRLLIEQISEKVVAAYVFLREEPQWLIPWIMGSLLLALILGKLIQSEPNIKGSGIPQVEGQLRGQLSIHWFSVLWKKFIGGVLAISSGLFLGREGPSIQLGAVVAQGISEKMKQSKSEEKILISSGASAGLAAAFNAPIAGLLFVLEEVHHSFSPLLWLTSFSAAITANFVSLHFFGLKPVLYIGEIQNLPLSYYWTLPILGVLLGTAGRIYQKVLLALPKWYGKISCLSSNYYSVVPLLLIIPLGVFFPYFLGGGNQIVFYVSVSSVSIWLLLALFLFRFIFSMISYGSNLPGGIFLPILSLGAILGTIYGLFLHQVLGIDADFIKNFLIFSMAGYFAAIGKAPLTAIVLVTEMVGNLAQLMSIGIVVLTSYIVADCLGAKPIYETLLDRLVRPDFGKISGKKTVMTYSVAPGGLFDEQMIRDIKWPQEMLVTSIRRGETELLTHGDTVMLGGDGLLILTDAGIAQKIRMQLQQMEQGDREELSHKEKLADSD